MNVLSHIHPDFSFKRTKVITQPGNTVGSVDSDRQEGQGTAGKYCGLGEDGRTEDQANYEIWKEIGKTIVLFSQKCYNCSAIMQIDENKRIKV